MRSATLPTQLLLEAYGRDGCSIISVAVVPRRDVSKYGIISTGGPDASGLLPVFGIVEKPEADMAPSRFASIWRYVFGPEVFEILKHQEPGYGGEIQLADAINTLAKSGAVAGQVFEGRRYDCGSKFGFLEAIVETALAHPDFAENFREFLLQRLSHREAAE